MFLLVIWCNIGIVLVVFLVQIIQIVVSSFIVVRFNVVIFIFFRVISNFVLLRLRV